jgi:hypothetical protein
VTRAELADTLAQGAIASICQPQRCDALIRDAGKLLGLSRQQVHQLASGALVRNERRVGWGAGRRGLSLGLFHQVSDLAQFLAQ